MEYNIASFVENLLQKKGITGLSDEVMTQMKNGATMEVNIEAVE